MIELAERVIALTGTRSKLIREASPIDDPKQRKPDIDLARRELDWQPTVQLDEGLKLTIEYFDQVLRKPGKA
jgi:UDP-glucuronate decarboxylase